jgi:integrase
MAVVRRYPNGRWQGIVRRKGYPAQSETFGSQSEAAQWARQIESQMDHARFQDHAPAQRTTLADAIDRYLAEVTPRKRSARREKRRFKLLRTEFAQYTLLTLRRETIAEYRDRRLNEGAAAATVVKDLNSLTHLFEVARRDWGYAIPENPAKLVRRPAVGQGRNRRLTQAEYETLVAACKQSRSPLLLPIVELALETAMRLGELLAARWSDVDLEQRCITLHTSKNGHPRAVPLSALGAVGVPGRCRVAVPAGN